MREREGEFRVEGGSKERGKGGGRVSLMKGRASLSLYFHRDGDIGTNRANYLLVKLLQHRLVTCTCIAMNE